MKAECSSLRQILEKETASRKSAERYCSAPIVNNPGSDVVAVRAMLAEAREEREKLASALEAVQLRLSETER
jgi:hypothetical protein